MVPILPEDNVLMTLPFGGAVLRSLGYPAEEINAILETKRKEVLSAKGLNENEEELALLQLGISQRAQEDGANGEEASVKGELNPIESAAADAVVGAKEKSPMVAAVIEANCPGSKVEDDAAEPTAVGSD
jgi:hypothetical protein